MGLCLAHSTTFMSDIAVNMQRFHQPDECTYVQCVSTEQSVHSQLVTFLTYG